MSDTRGVTDWYGEWRKNPNRVAEGEAIFSPKRSGVQVDEVIDGKKVIGNEKCFAPTCTRCCVQEGHNLRARRTRYHVFKREQ